MPNISANPIKDERLKDKTTVKISAINKPESPIFMGSESFFPGIQSNQAIQNAANAAT